MRLLGSTNRISHNLRTTANIPSRHRHDQPREKHVAIGICQRGPRRSWIRRVDCHWLALRFGDSCRELTCEVQKQAFGDPVLIRLHHLAVVAQMLEVRAALGDTHER